MISKLFTFTTGSAIVELDGGILHMKLQSGSISWKLFSEGYITLCPVSCLKNSITAALFSGHISAEETDTCLTLHTNPTDAAGAPLPAFMVHFRVEAVNNCALRLSCWIGSREPALGNMSWLSLNTFRKSGMRLHGFKPSYDAEVIAVSHGLRFQGCGIYDESGFVTLSDGDIRFLSQNGTDTQDTPLCALIPKCGMITRQNLA